MAFNFSTPAPQQQQQQQQPLFGQSSPAPSFSQTGFQFQQPQPQPQPQQQQQFQGLFPQQQQQQPQQPHQQILLYCKDGSPAGYHTKFEELHPYSQKLMLQIQERINEYKDESQRLDQCSRLYEASVCSDSFELDANRIIQELGGISITMQKEKYSVEELMDVVKNMMWATESAVRSYMMLTSRFNRPNVASTTVIGTSAQTTGAIGASGVANNPVPSSMMSVSDFYYGLPKRPSPFMQQTVARFEKNLTECCRWIEELEQLLLVDTDKYSSSSDGSMLQSIPKVMSNVHDFFIHVAAKVENLHQCIESMKAAYLADQRRRGDGSDPFLEADRRETSKQEAAARRVHPTLHLPAIPAQPSTQVAGLFASSATPILTVPQQHGGTSATSSTAGFSIFSTPSSGAPAAASTSSFPFSTPTASAQTSSLFGSSTFTPQSTPFATGSTSLFGSVQTPSLFGSSTPSFASTPAATGTSLFSISTLPSGAVTGSGASFGAASRSTKPKSRSTTRR